MVVDNKVTELNLRKKMKHLSGKCIVITGASSGIGDRKSVV